MRVWRGARISLRVADGIVSALVGITVTRVRSPNRFVMEMPWFAFPPNLTAALFEQAYELMSVGRESPRNRHVNPVFQQWTHFDEQGTKVSKAHHIVFLKLAQDNTGVPMLLLSEQQDPGT